MKNKKTIMIVILCTLVAVMAIGYAFLAQQLNINGRASIDSTWKVEITNITEKDIVGDASSKETPSYTSTTANFSVGLIQPGDSITYDVEISNLGTLKAKVDSINVTMGNNAAITYTTSGVQQGDKLGVGEKATLSVTIAYNSEVTSQPTNTAKEITVTINYIQDLGISSEPSIAYNTYSIGDVVSFAGSNWYVIKNSTSEEDYVTLLKETVLTNAELGEYAWSDPYVTMPYYWSDTCHLANSYGYTNEDYSGCAGHNDYEGSKVKELLEESYINTLGSDNLKEVDGYKIRLIKTDELNANLGWTNLYDTVTSYNENSNVPLWIYHNYGDAFSYWTMTPYPDDSFRVWAVNVNGGLNGNIIRNLNGIRPVINLLKSNI